MGMLHSELGIIQSTVDNIISILTSDKKDEISMILRMRAMWFLERVSRNRKLFKESKEETSK